MIPWYLCAGFGEPIGGETLDLISNPEFGFSGVRQGIGGPEGHPPIEPLVAEFAGRPLRILFVLNDRQAIEDTPRVIDAAVKYNVSLKLEPLNEPDIKPDWTPEEFGEAVWYVDNLFPGGTVSGGISSTHRRGLDFLKRAISLIPEHCSIGVHTYRDSYPTKPHKGFASRDAEWAELRAIIGNREVWNTEVGWHTAKRSFWPCVKPLTDDEVARRLREEARICEDAGCKVITLYQLNDGGNDPLGRFGIRKGDGSLKPSAFVVQRR